MTASLNTLAAVNEVLVHLGERPINSLSNAPASAVTVESKLGTVSRNLQNRVRGWWFNRENNYELTVDGSGRFPIPSDALSVGDVDGTYVGNLAVRDGYLWNTAENTDVWDETEKKVLLVRLLDFDDLPPKAQEWCIARAAYELGRSFGMTKSDRDELRGDEVRVKSQLESMDSDGAKLNLFHTISHQRAMKKRRSPLDRLHR